MVLSALIRWIRLGLAVSGALILATTARGEWDDRFQPFYFNPADPETVYLDGPIDPRTALALSRALEAAGEPRTMVLSSPGGDVYAALLMAREIDARGLATVIPEEAICFSACAYLYLAGHDRRADGELGVHQISSHNPDFAFGQVALSDIVEILGDFDVPNEVLVLMLRTSAEDMHVFTPEEVAALGLAGPRVDGAAPTRIASAPPAPAGPTPVELVLTPTPEQDALTTVAYFNEVWSEDNMAALREIRSMYASQVEFYGSVISLEAVMEDKATFAERWTERDYSLDTTASVATCASPTSCLVEGEVVWDARTPDSARHSVGRAKVFIGLEWIDGRFLIVREDGHVLERH